jgi:hypothetical protein
MPNIFCHIHENNSLQKLTKVLGIWEIFFLRSMGPALSTESQHFFPNKSLYIIDPYTTL